MASGRFVESVETLWADFGGTWQSPSRRATTTVCAEERKMLMEVVSRRFRGLLRGGFETRGLPVNALEGRVSLREEPELHFEVVARRELKTGESLNGMPGGSEPEGPQVVSGRL